MRSTRSTRRRSSSPPIASERARSVSTTVNGGAREVEIQQTADGAALPFAFERDRAAAGARSGVGRERRIHALAASALPRRVIERARAPAACRAGTTGSAARDAARCRAGAGRMPACGSSSGDAPRRSSAKPGTAHCACSSSTRAPPLHERVDERRQRRVSGTASSRARVERQSFARRRRRGHCELRASAGSSGDASTSVSFSNCGQDRRARRRARPPARDDRRALRRRSPPASRPACRAAAGFRSAAGDRRRPARGQAVAVSPATQRLSKCTPGSS